MMDNATVVRGMFVFLVLAGSIMVFGTGGNADKSHPNSSPTIIAAQPVEEKPVSQQAQAGGGEPCSPYWDAPNPCPTTPEEEKALLDEIAAEEEAWRPVSIQELRARAGELIQVESNRVADGYWQALVTITNRTPNLLERRNYVDCILFDPTGNRVAISSQVIADDDLGPGESFTDDSVAEVPDGVRIARHECRFRG